VRQISGIKTTGWSYPQSAIICTVEHAEENGCAWQRFLPSGPIALLPIGDNFSNIVWTMGPEESLHHKSMNPEEFVMLVNHALDFGYGPNPGFLDHYMEKLFSGIGNTAASTKECFEVPSKVTGVLSDFIRAENWSVLPDFIKAVNLSAFTRPENWSVLSDFTKSENWSVLIDFTKSANLSDFTRAENWSVLSDFIKATNLSVFTRTENLVYHYITIIECM
jgi:hypothetical protein